MVNQLSRKRVMGTVFCLLGFLASFSCCSGSLVAQEARSEDEVPSDFQVRIDIQFGIHTNNVGDQTWSVGLRLADDSGHDYIALKDAEAAVIKIADSYIQRLQCSRCLTNQQISKLRLAAQMHAHSIVRQSDSFLQDVERFPLHEESNAELQEKVGRFSRENSGKLFAEHSLFARTWSTVVRSFD